MGKLSDGARQRVKGLSLTPNVVAASCRFAPATYVVG